MKKVFVIVLILALGAVLLGFTFDFRAWINYISENCTTISISSFLKDARNFPDFQGGIFDVLSDIGKLLYYPILLIYDILMILIEMLSNFVVILGGILGGVGV